MLHQQSDIQGGFIESEPLVCREALITFTKFHAFIPGSCPVQPQSELLACGRLAQGYLGGSNKGAASDHLITSSLL